MLRYCTNCEKDYDFSPTAVSGTKPLICPECGQLINKNSRHPVNREELEHSEEQIGNFFLNVFRFAYIFYLCFAIVGVVAFIFSHTKLLYIVTAISLIAFLLQMITGTLRFRSGIIFLPAGAVLGYLFFKNIQGALLGINIVFIIRHLIRDIFYEIIIKLIILGNSTPGHHAKSKEPQN